MDKNTFYNNVVFGSVPIGNAADISLNTIDHIMWADFILVESHRQFSRLITEVNALRLHTVADISPEAVIYQYQLESGEQKIDNVNERILQEAINNKKIFIISDEGSSVFLEPMSKLKNIFTEHGIKYSILPGPNSVISAIVSGVHNVNEFYFAGNFPWISENRKRDIFDYINKLRPPTVFILKAVGVPEYIKELSDNFKDGWDIDFALNLSMFNEQHVRGSWGTVINFIENNEHMWTYEDETKKVIVTLFPYNGNR